MSTRDERRQRQQRFAQLDAVERRAIVKAVNRGNPVETRKHAPHAVHMAQRQMRFWRWSWLIGPAVGLIQIGQLGLLAAVINALLASAFLGAMSAFFYLRARRAEEANLALVDRRRSRQQRDRADDGTTSARDAGPSTARTPRRWWGGRDRRPQPSTSDQPTGHLPGEAPRAAPTEEPDDEPDHGAQRSDEAAPGSGARRPYQPRGKKRRRR